MPTIAEVLRDRVSLDVTCVDRVYLNGYVARLQVPGQVVTFLHDHLGYALPSPALLGKMTARFHQAVAQFAVEQGVPLVTFAKGETKETLAEAHLARYQAAGGTHGVVLIGKAQEKASAFEAHRTDRVGTRGTPGKVWFTYARRMVHVTHYYFYVLDRDFGLAFIKVASYLPFEVKVWVNGHAWAQQQLRREGIAFTPLENGFARCADPARLQALCATLTGSMVHAFFDRWVDVLPWPLSPGARAAGYRHALSIWNLEVSRTQVLVDPAQGRALVETLIRENLDLGRPDRVRLLFDRPVRVNTPSRCFTQVDQYGMLPSIRVHYKHSALKQYLKGGQALRTEAMLNNPGDFSLPRGITHFATLVALGHQLIARLLAMVQVSQDCFVPLDTVQRLGQATVDAHGHRAPALRFGDPRVMAVLAAVVRHAHLPAGLTNKALRADVATALGVPRAAYSSTRLSYDLRRLRLKGLVVRRPRSHAYTLTPLGAKVAVFFTKLATRCFRPGLAALIPDQPHPTPLAQALAAVTTAIHALVADAHLTPATAAA